jgi:hypothetical protein
VGAELDTLEMLEDRAHAAFCELAGYLREHRA